MRRDATYLRLLIGEDAEVVVWPRQAPPLCRWKRCSRGVVYWACQCLPDNWLRRATTRGDGSTTKR